MTDIIIKNAPGAPATTPGEQRRQYWAARISANWQKAVESIIQCGLDLIEAREEIAHQADSTACAFSMRFTDLVERLPFEMRTAERLMKVASHPILADPSHGTHLPPSWRTLSELATLPAPFVEARITDGSIHAGMQRKDAYRLKDAANGPDHAAAKHAAKITPLQQMREEINAKDGEIADLNERLASAEAAEPLIPPLFLRETTETIVRIIINHAGKEKAKAIFTAGVALLAKEESYTVENAPVVAKRRGRPKGSKNKPR